MKMFRVLILFAIILIAFGCDDKNPTENDPDPGEVILSDETVVLEQTQVNEDLQEVSQDGNTFTFTKTSTTEDFEEGNILVSGITDLMPNGFLKKVVDVQENSTTITVITENASLDEALQQGDLSANYTFLPSRIENSTFADGVKLVSNSREDLFSLEINAIFYDADGNTNTTDDQIRAVGTLNFTAEMLMNIDINNWQLEEFDIQLINTFEKNLTFENNIEYNLQEELNLVEFHFPVLTIPIGLFFPVTIHPTISIDAYVDASLQAGISFGVTATETMTTGAMYENNTWSPISSYEKTLGFNGPNGYGSIDVQAGLKPQLKTMIYTVVGPYIVLDAYGKYDCSVEVSFDDLIISEEISYGLDLDAGLLIEILSHTIANFSMNIYDDEWILHQYEYTIGQAPVATIISPSNGSQFDLGATVNFTGSATDLQDGDLTGNDLEWISNVDGSLGYGENLSISDLTQGPHSITLIATDSDDYTGEDDVSINIIGAGNNPPSMPFDPSPSDESINVSINTNLSWDCTDPDGDPLTYDVYFGTSPNPPLFEQDLSQSSFDLDELDYEETYYWKIKAFDDHDNSTTGDIWEFTTMEENSGNIPTDYIAFYPFNENGNDVSSNSFNMNEIGTIAYVNDRNNNPNSCPVFDGDSYYEAISSLPDASYQSTYSFWINWEDNSNAKFIFCTDEANAYWPHLYGFYCELLSDGTLVFSVGKNTTDCEFQTDTGTIQTNMWTHILFSLESYDNIILYIDGVQTDIPYFEGPLNDTIAINGYPDRIGRQYYQNGSHIFIGKIDDFRIYSRILDESEIQALYHEGGWDE